MYSAFLAWVAIIVVANQEDENCEGHCNGDAGDSHCRHHVNVSDDGDDDDDGQCRQQIIETHGDQRAVAKHYNQWLQRSKPQQESRIDKLQQLIYSSYSIILGQIALSKAPVVLPNNVSQRSCVVKHRWIHKHTPYSRESYCTTNGVFQVASLLSVLQHHQWPWPCSNMINLNLIVQDIGQPKMARSPQVPGLWFRPLSRRWKIEVALMPVAGTLALAPAASY